MTPLDRSELIAHVREQAYFLRSSCAGFDAGQMAEAKRIAVALRVLVHDTRQSKSLLGQLGWLSDPFASVASEEWDDRVVAATGPLVAIGYDGYFPHLEPISRWVPFTVWWEEPVYKMSALILTRRDYVLASSNKGGGAHVEASLDNIYRDLAYKSALGWQSFVVVEDADGNVISETPDENSFFNNPMPVSLRTMAHEMLTTLAARSPDLA